MGPPYAVHVTDSAQQQFFKAFSTRTPQQVEADVQFAIAAFLTTAELGLADAQVAKVEEQTADGTRRRIDITYGRLVIEVKLSLGSSALTTKAENQLGDYLRTLRDRDGYEYAGLLTDGIDWHLYALAEESQVRVDSFHTTGDPRDRAERLRLWLQTILLTGDRIPATPARVAAQLGTTSPRFLLDRKRLELLFNANAHSPEVGLKRQLWARLLRTALGTSFSDDAALFIDHTLLVLEAEIIAHLVVGLHPEAYSAIDIASGSHFKSAGITNVVEADFFDWPAEVEGGSEFVRSLVQELAQFDWANVSHDVLKVLYEAIIDPTVRKNLGEYYTPDWLAEKIIAETVLDSLNERVMDPACGSGTFVFHAVRRFLAAADAAGMANKEAIDMLQDRVFGMDIHPVSVVLARVTYLLAISPERLADRGPLTVPVYLGDSVQWTRGVGTMGANTIQIEVDADDLAMVDSEEHVALWSTGQQLSFPISSIDDPATFDRLVTDLTDLAQTHTDATATLPSISAVLTRHAVSDAADRQVLTATFATLCSLNADGRDHIWGYFVRNQIRPLWFSLPHRRMDVLIGNPPWVAYRYMTASMQGQFKALCLARNLWAGGKVATHQDLVALFIVRVIEQFLTDNGKFGFVTPFAVLSRMQYEGFRDANWLYVATDDDTKEVQRVRAAFDTSWDLTGVRPAIFPVPAAVVFGRRATEPVALPSETIRLSGLVRALTKSTGQVKALRSSDISGSPYSTRPIQGATLVPRVLLFVNRQPAGPLGRPQGTTDVVSARSTQEKQPWKSLPSVEGPIEEKFVHPVLLGASVAPYRLLGNFECVLPVHNGKLLSNEEIGKHQLMANWWVNVTNTWEANKSAASKLSLMDRIDFQNTLQRQLPAASNRLVYAASGNRTAAVVVTDPSMIIEHKLYWVATESADEAQYLVVILNSNIVAALVGELQSLGLFGARDIDTLPWRLPIPLYDANNELHAELVSLALQAELSAANVEIAPTLGFPQARLAIRTALEAGGLQSQIEAAVSKLLNIDLDVDLETDIDVFETSAELETDDETGEA